MPEQLPRDFGRYRLISLLGVGGMASVYRAEITGGSQPGRKVAIKRIPLAGVDAHVDDMLLDEVRIWRRLKHRNVVQVIEFGLQDDDWFLALELVEGVSLSELMKSVERMAPAEAMFVAEQVALGLSHAHTRADENGKPLGIVHRDIKPGNILISTAGEVKITDFGIARATDRISHTQAGVVKGSLYFLSPEQARGEPVDARSDLFSLGCVLHVMLTGGALIDLDDDAALFDALSSGKIPAPPATLPPRVREVLASLTAADPAGRPADALDAARRLRAAVDVADLDGAGASIRHRVEKIAETMDEPFAAPPATSPGPEAKSSVIQLSGRFQMPPLDEVERTAPAPAVKRATPADPDRTAVGVRPGAPAQAATVTARADAHRNVIGAVPASRVDPDAVTDVGALRAVSPFSAALPEKPEDSTTLKRAVSPPAQPIADKTIVAPRRQPSGERGAGGPPHGRPTAARSATEDGPGRGVVVAASDSEARTLIQPAPPAPPPDAATDGAGSRTMILRADAADRAPGDAGAARRAPRPSTAGDTAPRPAALQEFLESPVALLLAIALGVLIVGVLLAKPLYRLFAG